MDGWMMGPWSLDKRRAGISFTFLPSGPCIPWFSQIESHRIHGTRIGSLLLHQLPNSRLDLLIASGRHNLRLVRDADVGFHLVVLAALSIRSSPAAHRNAKAYRRIDLVLPPDECSRSRNRHPEHLANSLQFVRQRKEMRV